MFETINSSTVASEHHGLLIPRGIQTLTPEQIQPPIITIVTSSDHYQEKATMDRYNSMMAIISSLKWDKYVVQIDLFQMEDRREWFHTTITENAEYPYLFFQGKTLGGLDQVLKYKERYNTKTNQNGLQTIMQHYLDWASTDPRCIFKGCNAGFQLRLDHELLPSPIPKPSILSVEAKHDGVNSFPNIVLGVGIDKIRFDQLMYDLMLKFCYTYVRNNEPESSSIVLRQGYESHSGLKKEPQRKMHRRCFRGSELVDHLSNMLHISSFEARELGQMLMDFSVIRQVERKDIQLFNNSRFLYRFSTHDNPMILNRLLSYPRRNSKEHLNPMTLIRSLSKRLIQMYQESNTPDGRNCDIRQILYDSRFVRWRIAVCELQHVFSFDITKQRHACRRQPIDPYLLDTAQSYRFKTSPTGLAAVYPCDVPKYPLNQGSEEIPRHPRSPCDCSELSVDSDLIKSFFINLYNMGIHQSFIQVGIPNTNVMPYSFFCKIGYIVGIEDIKLMEIYSQILRLGRKRQTVVPGENGEKPAVSTSTWTNDSASLKHLELDSVDARIHFALQDGHKALPIDTFIEPATINSQLDQLAKQFCSDPENVSIEIPVEFEHHFQDFPNLKSLTTKGRRSKLTKSSRHKATIYLARLFETFETDFGDCKLSVLWRIATDWLTGDKQRLFTRVLDLYDHNVLSIGVKYNPFDWEPIKVGIEKWGKFPFTEEHRSDESSKSTRMNKSPASS